MGVRQLLVSDIDGTLLNEGEPTPGLQILKKLLQTHSDDVALVYATGRSLASTVQLIDQSILPMPHGIAPFVGTEVWFPKWHRSRAYQQTLEVDWQPEIIRQLVMDQFNLQWQADHFQSEWKMSFHVEDPEIVRAVKQALTSRGLKAKVVYSCGKYLDIIPANAGKASVVQFLQKKWRIAEGNVLTCGDSGNDVDMLSLPETCNVAVGNLEKELARLAHKGNFYVAELPYAGGVLEGAVAFDFWPAAANRFTVAKRLGN